MKTKLTGMEASEHLRLAKQHSYDSEDEDDDAIFSKRGGRRKDKRSTLKFGTAVAVVVVVVVVFDVFVFYCWLFWLLLLLFVCLLFLLWLLLVLKKLICGCQRCFCGRCCCCQSCKRIFMWALKGYNCYVLLSELLR